MKTACNCTGTRKILRDYIPQDDATRDWFSTTNLRSCFRQPVFARSVQAGIRQHQPLNWLSTHNMGLDNLIDIVQRDPAVPDGFRIDDNVWPMLALIETARLVRPYFPFQSARRQFLFKRFL